MSYSPSSTRWPVLGLLTRESAVTGSGSVCVQYAAVVWEAMIVGSLPSRSNMIFVRSSCPRWLIPMVRKSSRMSTSVFL